MTLTKFSAINFAVSALTLMLLCVACAVAGNSQEPPQVDPSDLSYDSWTETTETRYYMLLSHPNIIGMQENGQWLLMLTDVY